MFLHLGGNTVVSKKEIIAILDARTRDATITNEFIAIAGYEGYIENIGASEKAKSFIITDDKIYISPISCTTLKKRSNLLPGIHKKARSEP